MSLYKKIAVNTVSVLMELMQQFSPFFLHRKFYFTKLKQTSLINNLTTFYF